MMRRWIPPLAVFLMLLAQAPPARAAWLDNLEAHWKLEEASGTRLDETANNNDLTDNNTVTQATGKIGTYAGQFTAANTEYLSIADNTSLSTGDIDFTVAAWIYLDSTGTSRTIASKGVTNQYEWHLDLNSSDVPFLQIYTPGGGNRGTATWGSGLSASTWYLIVAWHDAAANTVNIQVDNGSPVSSAATGPTDGTGDFYIGRLGDLGRWTDGRTDSFSFWKRVLTAQERTDLYNCGDGLDYDFSAEPCGGGARSFGTILFRIPVGFPVGGLTWPIW